MELIKANSPQAKGRVERRNGTLQDRLVKALRLAGISDLGAANAYLEATFLPDLNGRFAVDPAGDADAHRRLGAGGVVPGCAALPAGTRLDEVLCEREERVVGRDWWVQWRGRVLQVDAAHGPLGLAGRRVTVREKLDGTVQVLWDGRLLAWQEVPCRPKAPKPKKPVVNNRRYVPPPDHPWKRRPAVAPAAAASSAAPPQPLPPGRPRGEPNGGRGGRQGNPGNQG